MNLTALKRLIARRLRHFGVSEAILARGSRFLNLKARSSYRDIKRDYEELHAQLGGGLAPIVPPEGAPRTLILSPFDEFYFIKVDAVMARALMVAGHDVTVVKSSRSLFVERYFRLFGVTKFVVFENCVREAGVNPPGTAECAALRSPFTFTSLMGFKFFHFNIGEYILSTLLGTFRFGHLNLESSTCRNFVLDSLAAMPAQMEGVKRIFDANRPDNLLLQEKGYLPNALFWDEALHRRVNFIQWTFAQETNALVLKKFASEGRKQHPLSLSRASWTMFKGKIWTDALDIELAEMFRQRYEKDDWYNRNFLRAKSPIVAPDSVRSQLRLDPARKTAVVFSHILWDATFFFGENLFQDYEVWLLKTIRCACANPNLNWIIKLHPDYSWKLARAGAKLDEPEMLKREFGELPEHVQLMLPDSPINTYSLFQVADYCVTVRGTAGIEMACLGKPVLVGGTGRYSGLGFTIDSRSQDEYLNRLNTLHTVEPLGREQTILARKFAYALYKLRPFRHRSFRSRVNTKDGADHPLFINYDYSFRTAEEFAAAADLKQFAAWFDSPDQDFILDWPSDPAAQEASRLRMPWDGDRDI